jgi:hypothetical protein
VAEAGAADGAGEGVAIGVADGVALGPADPLSAAAEPDAEADAPAFEAVGEPEPHATAITARSGSSGRARRFFMQLQCYQIERLVHRSAGTAHCAGRRDLRRVQLADDA